VDVLVNNVGGSTGRAFDSADDAAWEHTFQLNLFSGIRLTRLTAGPCGKSGRYRARGRNESK
ncbi:MAG: SDR family NAD(P)-dependent oxidoreductase, partial [Candidatus Methylomirabilia bacterium]